VNDRREDVPDVTALVASVVHEIRGALQTITSLSELLERDPDRDDRVAAAARLRRAALRARRFAQDLIDVARPLSIEWSDCDIRELLLDAVDACPPSENESVALTLDLPPELPPLRADPLRALQILSNLVTNARDSTARKGGSGSIILRVRIVADTCVIDVEDDGIGVPDALLPRLFTPFASGHRNGTGLGLWISRRLAEAMGGALRHEARPAGGAVFTLGLPVGRTDAPAPTRVESPQRRTLDVMIIDDDVELLETYAAVLEHAGHRVRAFTRGRDALATLKKVVPDVIVCDVRLPDIDGPDVLRAIRETHPAVESRLIFATGDAGTGSLAALIPPGPHQLLEKPFELEALEAAIARAAARTRDSG